MSEEHARKIGELVDRIGERSGELRAQIERLVKQRDRAQAAASAMYAVLQSGRERICDAICPSTWKTADGQPHSDLCKSISAALAKASGDVEPKHIAQAKRASDVGTKTR